MCGGKFTYVGRVSAMRGAKSCLQAFELGWLEGTIIAGVMIVVKGPSDDGGVESTEAKGCLGLWVALEVSRKPRGRKERWKGEP